MNKFKELRRSILADEREAAVNAAYRKLADDIDMIISCDCLKEDRKYFFIKDYFNQAMLKVQKAESAYIGAIIDECLDIEEEDFEKPEVDPEWWEYYG